MRRVHRRDQDWAQHPGERPAARVHPLWRPGARPSAGGASGSRRATSAIEAGGSWTVTGAPAPVGTRPAALVVVEVKTRTTLSAGPPAAAVDSAKLARLRTLAAAWAAEHSAPHGRLRLDVISVLLRPGLPAELRHHRGVGLT